MAPTHSFEYPMLPPLYSEGSQSYSRSRSSSASTASDVSTRADSIFPYKDELEHPERMSRVSGRDQYPPNLGLKDVSTEVDRYSDGLEDEEEQVGLMQRDRDWQRGQGSAKSSKLSTIRSFLRRTIRAPLSEKSVRRQWKGLIVALCIFLSLLLFVPFVGWLAHNDSSAETVAASVVAGPKSGSDVGGKAHDRPNYYTATKQAPSSNTQSGGWGLGRANGFAIDFEVPGWSTAEEAKVALKVDGKSGFKGPLRQLEMEELFNGTFSPQFSDLNWCAEDPRDGVFSHVDPLTGDIIVEDVKEARTDSQGKNKASSRSRTVFVRAQDVKDNHGNLLRWDSFKISPDMRYVMFTSDRIKQWRYSSRTNVWIHDVTAKHTFALGGGPIFPPSISYAAWGPHTGAPSSVPALAYVQENDLYVSLTPMSPSVRITNDGAASIFNAVPDWVYEEEIFGGDFTLWFSPGGTKLAYLRFDETDVPVYEFPVYNSAQWTPGETKPYLETTKMKYPKPGYPNPTVSVHLVDLGVLAAAGGSTGETGFTDIERAKRELRSPADVTPAVKDVIAHDVDVVLASGQGAHERLVTEVTWLSDEHLLIKETSRVSDVLRVILFDMSLDKGPFSEPVHLAGESAFVGEVVRRWDTRREGGWIEVAQTMVPLALHDSTLNSTAYLDIVPTPEGFRHVAYFDSARSQAPLFLTKGHWEIDGSLKLVDPKRRKAYFIAAQPTPAQRHVFSIELPDVSFSNAMAQYQVADPVPLTNMTEPSWYDANFDPKGAFYVLDYRGPNIPIQRVRGLDDPSFDLILQDNEMLHRVSALYVKPQIVFYNITTDDGIEVSIKEIRPHDFDASGRTLYPVLVRVYGGPNSQMVHSRYERDDWHQYLACGLGYVVAVVDGRGTGFKGREFRSPVTGNLGDLEAVDVIASGQKLASLPYIDEKRVGIWGWSYGGYLTNKVIEKDSAVFNLGMAVAPVTSWNFYDSVYTERYMKTPQLNPGGYRNASVHNTTGFGHANYLLAHGSGDDNVHFEHSAHLLDLLTANQVRGFRFRMFTDSDHSMSMRGAYRELFEFLTSFLREKWGAGGKRKAATARSTENLMQL